MKIKTKKTMNLPQLIEWAWGNDVKDKVFWTTKDKRGVSYEACFSEGGNFYSDDELDSELVFTVEVDEEITEDTVFENLIEIYETPEGMNFSICYRNASINYVENDHYLKTLAIHILNDDLTMTLIWRNGKLVE